MPINRTLKYLRRWLVLVILVALHVGSIAWRVQKVRANEDEQEQARTAMRRGTPTVAVAPVTRQVMQQTVDELVSLRAPLNVNISSKVVGRLRSLYHFEGDSVRQ